MFSTLKYYYNVQFSNRITNQIWLGNYVDSSNETFIKNQNIKVIVNCSRDLPFYFNKNEVPFRYRIPVDDDRQDNSIQVMFLYLSKIVELIKRHVSRGENIYIHCHAGMQRSACVMAAYLMAVRGFSPAEAIQYIKRLRPIAFTPFVNFQKSLDNYGMTLKQKNN
jgi:protein-tyrosine phosphatase